MGLIGKGLQGAREENFLIRVGFFLRPSTYIIFEHGNKAIPARANVCRNALFSVTAERRRGGAHSGGFVNFDIPANILGGILARSSSRYGLSTRDRKSSTKKRTFPVTPPSVWNNCGGVEDVFLAGRLSGTSVSAQLLSILGESLFKSPGHNQLAASNGQCSVANLAALYSPRAIAQLPGTRLSHNSLEARTSSSVQRFYLSKDILPQLHVPRPPASDLRLLVVVAGRPDPTSLEVVGRGTREAAESKQMWEERSLHCGKLRPAVTELMGPVDRCNNREPGRFMCPRRGLEVGLRYNK
ncbi:hypothetical protein J6590_029127 [Homalodisca vitripennis]|nr:hypothetical protein J6590_029127 [Homalodisca vitripennis]